MNTMKSILVPLDGSAAALKAVPVAIWLASCLNARAYILWAGEPMPEEDIVERLGIEKKFRALVTLLQVAAPPAQAIVSTAQAQGIELVIMTARGEAAAPEPPGSERILGHVTREVIEQSAAPVLVLPPHYEESLPWRSILVPMSGEPATDEALGVALHLAHALDLRVTVAHVTSPAHAEAEAEVEVKAEEGWYPDELHHEFAQKLNQLVARACPMCPTAELSRVEAFHIKRGDIGDELAALIEEKAIGLIVIGWHGEFMLGHAQVLKRLARQITQPILLIKPAPRPRFRLKVGEAFE